METRKRTEQNKNLSDTEPLPPHGISHESPRCPGSTRPPKSHEPLVTNVNKVTKVSKVTSVTRVIEAADV